MFRRGAGETGGTCTAGKKKEKHFRRLKNSTTDGEGSLQLDLLRRIAEGDGDIISERGQKAKKQSPILEGGEQLSSLGGCSGERRGAVIQEKKILCRSVGKTRGITILNRKGDKNSKQEAPMGP